ncbi:MAG: HAD hydrolase-like protein [Cyclobacteriaceae bacterium]
MEAEASSNSSPGKQDLFHYLAKKYTLGRDEILIIGDNAESEIKAARQLGIQYVHIVRNSTTPYSPEQRMINSFTQLNYFL